MPVCLGWLCAFGVSALVAFAPCGVWAESAVLGRAQELFGQNRWAQARAELREHADGLAAEERPLAQLLAGRALAREAEFYAAASAFEHEVGLDYLRALAEPGQPKLRWLPLFTGLYELAAGSDREAERALGAAAADARLPAALRAQARLRQAVARHRLGQAQGTRALQADHTPEGACWRAVLPGLGGASVTVAAAQRAPDRLFAACAQLRFGKASEAEALLAGAELDGPALEDGSDPGKQLRFYDPQALEVLARIRWEQAALALEPLGAGAESPRAALGAFYAAWSLYQVGRRDAARERLAGFASAPQLLAALRDRGLILAAAVAPAAQRPAAPELIALWQRSQADPESVLLWADLQAREWPALEPLASALPVRLDALAQDTVLDRASGGRWGLVRLRGSANPAPVLAQLSRLRDNSSKNKIERNDPLLLLALAVANYRSAAYAQSLETLFALSEAFPGLRGLHWNLQGVYAARQSAGGEARISP